MVKTTLSYVAALLLGAVTAIVGTSAHRAYPYMGVVFALIMVAAAVIFARAWLSWWGLILFALGWVPVIVAFAMEGPGGSLLILGDTLGTVWLYGGAGAIVLAAFIPRSVLVGRPVVQA